MGDIINKLETDLKCIICQEVFVTPTFLNCGHIFCALCIRKWMQKFSAKKNPPSCPLCKVEISSYVPSFNTANIIDNVYKHYLSDEEKSRRKRHEEERAEQFILSQSMDDNFNEAVDEVDQGIGIYDYDDSSESSVNSDIARRFDQLVDEAIETDEDLDDLDSTLSITADDQTLPENLDAIPKITIQKLPNGSWSTLNNSEPTEPRLPNGSNNTARRIEEPSTVPLVLQRLPNGGYEVGQQGIRGDKTNNNQSTLAPDIPTKDDSTSNTSDDEDESGGENDFKARQHLLVEAMLKDINEELKADINANESMEINPATPGDLGYYSGFSVESYSKEQAENEQEIVLEDMLDMKSELTKKLRNFRLCRRYPPVSSTDSSDQVQLQSNNNVEISESTPKRPRMVYSGFQLKVLEDHYIKTKYPDQTDCEHLAQITNLKKSQVKNWFNNRRSKEKRVSAYHVEVGEEDTSINQPSTSCWKGKSSAKFPSKSSNIRED